VCEVFKAWLGDDRKKTILSMLQFIVCRLMVTFQKRYERVTTCQNLMPPRVKTYLDKTLQATRSLVVTFAGNDEFQVMDVYTNFVVKLRDNMCGCNQWNLTGLSCKHACACIVIGCELL